MIKNNKKAFLVFGPESSGTRFFTSVLIKAGCNGDNSHDQKWDHQNPHGDLIVWRRSFPHFAERIYEDIPKMVAQLKNLGYCVNAFVTTRDWKSMLDSQLSVPHIRNLEEGLNNLQRAYPYIFSSLASLDVPFVVVSYEAILLYKHEYLKETLATFGLDYNEVEIKDGNSKYYKQ